MTKWTHISIKIPETTRVVLVANRYNNEIHTGFYSTEHKQFYTNTIHEEKIPHATHWAERPPGPK